jgi:putative PIN family toxin of toxin-antitoxin system
VLVSGILNPHGPPGRILDAILSHRFTVLHDDRILSEYQDVLLRPAFSFGRHAVASLLDFISSAGEHVSAREIGISLPDPDDQVFLEVAVAGFADALVTGNLKHFKTRKAIAVRILSPADFAQYVLPLSQ